MYDFERFTDREFNEKNTEIGINANVYIDSWKLLYPSELRSFKGNGEGLLSDLFTGNQITGNIAYNPQFNELNDKGRNSYSLGVNFSQILSKKLQMSISVDVASQEGLLSMPFQRVYFSDVANSFIDDFSLLMILSVCLIHDLN